MKERERAIAFARDAIAPGGIAHDNWPVLLNIAYVIVYPDEGAPLPDAALLGLAMAAAERGVEVPGGIRPHLIDALARACFLRGDTDRAIREQERPLSLAHSDSMREDFEEKRAEHRGRR